MCAALASLLRNATSPTEKRGGTREEATYTAVAEIRVKERRIESQVPRWARSAF